MGRPGFAELVKVGLDVLHSTLDAANNSINVQTGDAINGSVESNNAEWWQHTGVATRPAKATNGKPSCQVFEFKLPNYDVVLASKDVRGQSIYGNLADGEACFYAPGAQGCILMKADGSVSTLTSDDNTPAGNTVFTRVSPIENRFFAPFGTQLQDQTGWHMRTWHGAVIDAGGAGLPAPFSAYKSSIRLSADIISIDAAVLRLGRGPGHVQPVALAPTTMVQFAAVATALQAMQKVVEILAATPAAVGSAPAVNPLYAPAATAMEAATAAAAAINPLIAGKTSVA